MKVPYVDLSGFRRSLEGFGMSMAEAGKSMALSFDTIRYRMLVTNLMRTRTFEEATAIVNLRKARSIRNGARRHRAVKRARDELRTARKQYR